MRSRTSSQGASVLASPTYEIIRGDGPSGSFVELWDRSLAPGGLAFEVVQSEDGVLTLTGHNVGIPIETAATFIEEALAYLRPNLQAT